MVKSHNKQCRIATKTRLVLAAIIAMSFFICTALWNGMSLLYFSSFGGVDSWGDYVSDAWPYRQAVSTFADGAPLVYSSPKSGAGDIYKVLLTGTTRINTRITFSSAFEGSPMVSRDGNHIAFERETDGRRHIWLIGTDGSSEIQLTFGNVVDSLGTLSPDGSRLIINRSTVSFGLGRVSTAYLIDVNRRQEETAIGRYASFSSDGRQIVYNSSVNASDMWTMSIDGSNKARLGIGLAPRYALSGKGIVFLDDSGSGIWLISSDGSQRHFVCDGIPVFITTDGLNVVCFVGDHQEMWIVNLKEGGRRQMDLPKGVVSAPQWCWSDVGFGVRIVNSRHPTGEIYFVRFDSLQGEFVGIIGEE